MYFGSVKFFKHLIYTVFFGWLAVATFLAGFFGIKYFAETKKTAEAAVVETITTEAKTETDPAVTDITDIEDAAPEQDSTGENIVIPDGTSLEKIFLILTAKGYSSEDMLNIIRKADKDSFRSFVEKYIETDPEIGRTDSGTNEGMDSGAPALADGANGGVGTLPPLS